MLVGPLRRLLAIFEGPIQGELAERMTATDRDPGGDAIIARESRCFIYMHRKYLRVSL
jgi:hypothetical protein